jgi:hypothetical protein
LWLTEGKAGAFTWPRAGKVEGLDKRKRAPTT